MYTSFYFQCMEQKLVIPKYVTFNHSKNMIINSFPLEKVLFFFSCLSHCFVVVYFLHAYIWVAPVFVSVYLCSKTCSKQNYLKHP